MDFNPIYPSSDSNNENSLEQPNTTEDKSDIILNEDMSLSILNLVKLANTHSVDFEKDRKIAAEIIDDLRNELFKMSIKEKIEFLKVTTRLVEVNAKALRELYTIGMRTELAKQFLLKGIKNDRSVRNVTDPVSNLIKLLSQTNK